MKKTDVIIIGAGPVGLFGVHQLGIKGLKISKAFSTEETPAAVNNKRKPLLVFFSLSVTLFEWVCTNWSTLENAGL